MSPLVRGAFKAVKHGAALPHSGEWDACQFADRRGRNQAVFRQRPESDSPSLFEAIIGKAAFGGFIKSPKHIGKRRAAH